MHRVIKKALATFERESKLPSLEKGKAWHWLKEFCGACLEQMYDQVLQSIVIMPKDRLLSTIASWVKWKFNRREKDKYVANGMSWYGYSLSTSVGSCPLCAGVRSHCSACPLEIIGASCSLSRTLYNTASHTPYNTAIDTGTKTPLVNALWEAVEWAIEHEEERSEG